MIKILILLFICSAFYSCSSIDEEEKVQHTQHNIENKAAQYLSTGDNYRYKGDYQAAMEYYETSAQLFFMKWDKRSYILASIKKLLAAHKLNKHSYVKKQLKELKEFASLEKIKIDEELKAVEIRVWLKEKQYTNAEQALSSLVEYYKKSSPIKSAYYELMLVNEVPSISNEFKNEVMTRTHEYFLKLNETQTELYNNIEVSLFFIKGLAKYNIYESKNYVLGHQYIKFYEQFIKQYELVGHLKNLLTLKRDFYSAQGDTQERDFYGKQLKKYKNYKTQI